MCPEPERKDASRARTEPGLLEVLRRLGSLQLHLGEVIGETHLRTLRLNPDALVRLPIGRRVDEVKPSCGTGRTATIEGRLRGEKPNTERLFKRLWSHATAPGVR